MTSCRGVICGRMLLIAALIPQVHPFIAKDKSVRGKKRLSNGRARARHANGAA
jgi:hypothetical protein